MCGLAGFLGQPFEDTDRTLTAMTNAISHRGPDATGCWHDLEAGIGLGHRRLSIIDPSPAGAQPMVSADGRYIVVYNGEIYNFQELRADLESTGNAPSWQGHSDTEVLLALIARDGVEAAINRCDGMFAFALWDRKMRTLVLARDAFGEKPLYYGRIAGRLLFGSELRALTAAPGFDATLDTAALGSFLKYSYIPAPDTIWQGVFKLPAGHLLRLSRDQVLGGDLPAPQPWWDAVGEALDARDRGFDGSFEEAVAETERLLAASTARRMVSDVPLGAMLSGGVDSTMVTALMQAQSARPVQTFSIGMDEDGFDESPAAAAVAHHLGTHHSELVLSSADVQAAIPDVIPCYDEPFADSSQVPTWLVSRMARENVSVVLSGDGGDEIFAGYNRYIYGPQVWGKVGRLPPRLRRMLGQGLGALPFGLVQGAVTGAGRLAPREATSGRAIEKLQKLARVMSQPDEAAFHDRLLATAHAPTELLACDALPETVPRRADHRTADLGFAARAQMLDTATYLPDDIMTKVDRASMAVSLEARTPYLERTLYRFAWSLPEQYKLRGSTGKRVLREALYKHIPRNLVDRPKAGFAIPIGRWLRAGLRDWAETALSVPALESSGYLDAQAIRHRWQEHLSGKHDHDTLLWNVLMFQHWHHSLGLRAKPNFSQQDK